MEKSSCMDIDMDMDMEDWELLQVPNDSHTPTFDLGLEIGKEDPVFSKESTNFVPVAVFVDKHYFILPSKNQEFLKNSTKVAKEEEEELESLVEFKDVDVVAELGTREDIMASIGPEPISSGDDEDEKYSEEEEEEEEDVCVDNDDKEKKPCREEGRGLRKLWSWKLVGGVGALCSIGVAAAAAAATICVLVLGGGGRHQPDYETHSQTQRLLFQIYTDEKRIKQVVQQATRLNQALTAARAVPMTTTTVTAARANISFGGYYDGL